jgi:flagellar protein FliO/FliZ
MLVKAMVILQNSENFLKDLNSEPKEEVGQEVSIVNNLLQLAGLCLLLILILIAAYYTSKFVGRWKLKEIKSSNFNVVDTYRIDSNKMLQIIKVANKFLIIAVGKDTITYISELNEADITFKKDMDSHQKVSFNKIFEKIKNGNRTVE